MITWRIGSAQGTYRIDRTGDLLVIAAIPERKDCTLARQPSQGNEPASALTVLTTEADRLAERYRISIEQARQCLERLVSVFASDLLEQPRQLDRALRRYPLSLLADALGSLPKAVAVKLITEDDLPQLARRVNAVEWLVDEDTPLYTLDELANHAGAVRVYLQLHRDYLIQTGLPPRSFRTTCPWLYLNLARLYDTRTTDSPWPSDEFSDHNYTDDKPYTWVKMPHPEVNLGGDITACNYYEADLLNGMRREDADLLEANRDKLFTVKLRLMDLLIDAARRRNVETLWTSFMNLVTESFTPDEVAFFFQMDHFYLGTDARYDSDEMADPKMVPGGLTDWIEVLGHFEKEVKIGTLARTKRALSATIMEELTEPPKNGGYCRWSYFNVFGKPDQANLDTVLRQMFLRLDQEREFWTEFRHRVDKSLSDEFLVPVSIYVPFNTATGITSILQDRTDQMLKAWSAPTASTSTPGQAERVLVQFPPQDGLRWSEVMMEFMDNHSIRITARGVSMVYTFAELGFKDGRKGNLPDKPWEFLRLLAIHHGIISWETEIPTGVRANARKKVQLINERLQAVIGLGDRPILNYRTNKSYKTEFTLRMTRLEENLANSTRDERDED